MVDNVRAGSWRAMGCSVDVVLVGGPMALLDLARTSIDHLEQCWSRFTSHSDISRLNHAAGSTVHVDPATVVLLQAMLDGWRVTAGAFDPTLLAPLAGLGYAASWHDPAAVTSLPSGALARSDLEQMWIDRERNLVRAPSGQCLDAGGIGKGLAADLVAGQLLAAGADGVSVSIGGDVAVRGASPQAGGWLIGIADPSDDELECGQLAMIEGGVATSGTLRRRWLGDDGEPVHHLLDPATQRPAHHARQIVAATVIAGTAAWAEVWTKAVMVRGTEVLAELDDRGLGAQVTYADLTSSANQAWSSFAVQASSGATSLAMKST
ncbi:MAG: FAD:protein FMN transferase [Ilumatobacteraceae bacterium]|nr:FAD:protein FMN transferase [Ilumatobacteraceae bacterium]